MGDGDAPRLVPLDSCLRRNDACGRPPSSALRTGFDKLRANGFGKRACGGEWGCDGVGDAPRGAPLVSCLRRNDACGRPPSSALRTGFDRLRANGRGKRPYDGSRGCDGVGDAPRLAPLDSCLRRNDACGRLPSSALRTGFDRLRANGFGRRAFDGELGVRWGMETPLASPLWIPAFAGMTRAEGPLRVPSGQASTGSGRTDLGGARAVGSGGWDGGRRRPAPRPSGYRLSPVRRWGWGGWRMLLVSGGGPALAGRAIRESPLRREVGVGSAKGVGDGGAPPMPLWIPAFAGMTQRGGDAGAIGRERPPSCALRTGPSRASG